MTVTRQHQEEFQDPVDIVMNAVQVVLAKGGSSYRYAQPVLDRDGRCFRAIIKPSLWPLLLSTRISISVVPEETGTAVIVETRSQAFLMGDRFNFYTGYIQDFLSALNQTLKAIRID